MDADTQIRKETQRRREDMLDESNRLFRMAGLKLKIESADPLTKLVQVTCDYPTLLMAKSCLREKGWEVSLKN